MKYILNFVRNIVISRIAQLFVAIHWILFAYAFSGVRMTPIFHLENESLLFKAIIYLDLPALIVSTLVLVPANYKGEDLTDYWWVSWIAYAVMIVCISFQWGLIGYGIEKLIWKKPANHFDTRLS